MAEGDVLTIPANGNAEFGAPNIQVVRVPVTFADFVDVAGVGLALTDTIIPAGSILAVHPGLFVSIPFNDSGDPNGVLDMIAGVDPDIVYTLADANLNGSPGDIAPATALSAFMRPLSNGLYVVNTNPMPFRIDVSMPISFIMPNLFADDGTAGEAEGILFLIPPVAP